MRPAAAEAELLAALADRVAQLDARVPTPDQYTVLLADLIKRIDQLENTMSLVVAQLALTQADLKGLDYDMDELARARDDARRAITRLEAEYQARYHPVE